MKFNERLIKLRKAKGMSQEELGYELNVTRQTISKWELGESTPEMEKLIQISNYFGISVDELISNKDEETSSKNYNKEFVGVDEKYIPNDVKSEASYVNANKSSNKILAIPIIFMAIPIIMFFVILIYNISHFIHMQKQDINDMQDMKIQSINSIQNMENDGKEMINTMMDKSTNIVNTMVENNTVNENNSNQTSKKQEILDTIEDTEDTIENAVESYQNTWNEEEWKSRQEKMQEDFEKAKAHYEEVEANFSNY